MEYKKNRQRVVLEALKAQQLPDWNGLTSPAFLAEAKPVEVIAKSKKVITAQHKKLKQRIATILEQPNISDPVFKTLSKLFKNSNVYNLGRENNKRFEIRKLAEKRFVLGYPPRKKDDTSIGNAVNWEWIIHCAQSENKNVVIVTRDTDYGISYNNIYFLNDWLSQEFKQRVNQKRKVILTNRLTEAFELVKIKVNKKVEREEEDFVKMIKATAQLPGFTTTGTAIVVNLEETTLALPPPTEYD
jgi:hypothetical protein